MGIFVLFKISLDMAVNHQEIDQQTLPQEIVWEILSCLPIIAILKFQCVSKIWRSKIKDQAFVKRYGGGFKGMVMVNGFEYVLQFLYLNLDRQKLLISNQ